MVGADDFDIIFIMLGIGLIIGSIIVAMFFSNHCKDKEPPQQVCEDGSEFQNRWYEKRWFWGLIIPGIFLLIMGIIASVKGWGTGTKKAYAEVKDSTLKKVESSNLAPQAMKEAAVNKRAADAAAAATSTPSGTGQLAADAVAKGGKKKYKGKGKGKGKYKR
jgi:hypothetical protein